MRTIDLKVIPGARKNDLKDEDGQIRVYLTAPPVEGKANKALIAFLAKHYGVRRSAVEIIKGLKSRQKTVRINIPNDT